VAWWLFQNVVMTTALAATVWVICRATRIGPVARHALWLLVLVKFVTPPLVAWPWAAPDPLGLAALDIRVERPLETAVTTGEDLATAETPGRLGSGESSDSAIATSWQEGRARVASSTLSWLIWVWAAGGVGLVVFEGVRLARLARRVKRAIPADLTIAARVADLSARLGLRPVPVLTMPFATSPMVWCLGRPRLLWPASLTADSTDACLDGVLVHELAHVKRRDHFVGWIELAAAVVWWWNPLFWYVRSALREQAELACDAWVISALPDGRRAYAESLLALSGATLHGTPSSSMVAVIGIRPGSRRALERRLVMIMKGRAPLRLPLAGLLALVLTAAVALPAFATDPSQQTPPPPPTAVKPTATQALPPPPPPPPPPPSAQTPQPTRRVATPPRYLLKELTHPDLPADGKQLVEAFEKDRQAIQEEIKRKVDLRREELVKALEALQEQYTKAGKLDEAVAIRDYLRTGQVGRDAWFDVYGKAWNIRRR
jgi:beta-lactamase regulating signal transducer with metallopeptidase domain